MKMTGGVSEDYGQHVPSPRRLARFGVALLACLLVVVVLPRTGVDRAQAQTDWSIQMLHVVPVGAPTEPDMDVRIPATVDAVQAFLVADVGRALRVTPGVTTVSVTDGGVQHISTVLEQQGFDDPRTIYLAFAESQADGGACGQRLGNFAYVWMPVCDIYPGYAPQTWPFDATYLVLHEILHALGAVPSCAPNASGSHADDSNRDVLGVGKPGEPFFRDWNNLTIDFGNDDYYGHSIAGCPDIEDSPYWMTPGAPSDDECFFRAITIDMNTNGGNGIGTPGDDVILGTEQDDVIDGAGGDDRICSLGGNDTVIAGSGDDLVNAGTGDDVVRGNSGADRIDGGPGKDRLFGGIDDDELIGSEGADFLGGFGGADLINGGAGGDTIFGGFGADVIAGAEGADVIRGLVGNDTISGGPGNDELFGDAGNDRIDGGLGDDVIAGGNANDVLLGGSGDDQVSGGKGDDQLSGGDDIDRCVGNLESVADTADSTCETIIGVP